MGATMIQITPTLAIGEAEIIEEFVRGSGPGGQNVNKVSSAVQIRFNVRTSPTLPEDVRQRLIRLAGSRVTADGELIITARSHRDQPQNRAEALRQLIALIQRAAERPKAHLKTRPTRAAKQRRLDTKRHAGQIKRLRQTRHSVED